jgi:hypothetical protein
MKIDNPRVEQLYNYLSRINKTAYKDEFILANDVLAKSPFCGDILSVYLKNSQVEKVTLNFIMRKLFLFYVKNISWWAIHLIKKLAYMFSGKNYSLSQGLDQLTVIDIYCTLKDVVEENKFKDSFFPNLAKTISKKGKTVVYFPKFYGNVGLGCFFKCMRILKKSSVPVLTEFQVLRLSDYFCLIVFIALYPVKIIQLIKQLGNEYEDDLLRFALWDTLDTTVVKGHLRLLCGRRLSLLPVDTIKCVSWFENQSIDKCFYRGLRKVPNKVKIFGAQLFIWPDTLLNCHVDEEESAFGIIPDKIMVNGDYFLPSSGSSRFAVGPSMRYEKIFQVKVDPLNAKNILVLMPYWEAATEYLMNLIQGLSLDAPVLVKFHPTTDIKKYAARLQGNIKIVESGLYDLLEETKLVIGVSTGALIEAISLGIPAICIDNKSMLFHSYFSEHGKGIVWERAETASEVNALIGKFDHSLRHDAHHIQSISAELRRMLFCEPNEETIVNAFEL